RIDAEQSVISKRPYISNSYRHVGTDLLFDGQVPLVRRRCLRRSLDSLWGESTAGRRTVRPAGRGRLHAGRDRQKTRQRARKRNRAVVRRKRVQQESKIVDQCVVDPEACTDRSLACSERIPGKCDSRAEQPLCLVVGECRGTNTRIRRQNSTCIAY